MGNYDLSVTVLKLAAKGDLAPVNNQTLKFYIHPLTLQLLEAPCERHAKA